MTEKGRKKVEKLIKGPRNSWALIENIFDKKYVNIADFLTSKYSIIEALGSLKESYLRLHLALDNISLQYYYRLRRELKLKESDLKYMKEGLCTFLAWAEDTIRHYKNS